MDSHVFRRLCDELVPVLLGSRVEKIHQPARDVIMFTLYGHGAKSWLFLRFDRKQPFLFVSAQRVPVGIEPPAFIMRLRKYLSQQRFIDARVVWLERRLFLRVPCESCNTEQPTAPSQVWLELDLREGVRLHLTLPSAIHDAASQTVTREAASPMNTTEPQDNDTLWPSLPLPSLVPGDHDLWRQWPILSPALRRTLPLLPLGEQAALLGDLRTGGGDVLVYEDAAGQRELSAWPLPEPLRAKRRETLYESALKAAACVGETLVLHGLATKNREAAAKPHVQEAARLKRLLHKLQGEQTRLAAMADAQKTALALQAQLYRFAPDAKLAQIELAQIELAQIELAQIELAQIELAQIELAHSESPPVIVKLDPALTIRANMASLFHKAARGKRGLAMLAGRVQDVQHQLAMAEQEGAMARASAGATASPLKVIPQNQSKGRGITTQGKGRNLQNGGQTKGEQTKGRQAKGVQTKGVQAFRSHDGFLLLRGRDAKGNAMLLKLAAPHDLWMHTGGGAGAHVLVRRDHAAQEIPPQTLREAGILAVLKSERKDETDVDVIAALAKYVHPIKGARAGAVRIDRTETTLVVTPDPTLEQALAF